MKICVVGLGYVGLPLAARFGAIEAINGFDINEDRIAKLNEGLDETNEVSREELSKAQVTFSCDPKIIGQSDFIIIAVPTPIDDTNDPDLRLLLAASKTVGMHMSKGAIVVYESTVYPGCTERDCIPVLEEASGMTYKQDFKVGYSPERINPGDTEHPVENIVKVVSGCDPETTRIIAKVYGKVIKAGIHEAPSMMVAEAAKIIENTQRDINIALMNELKIIFDHMHIDWEDVIEAASTKWNFIRFTPGLVGGHCIGVDPYYLAYEARRLGHHPVMILSGRRLNDVMSRYETSRIIKFMSQKGLALKNASVAILGATFKPNINDTRNSKVKNMINELKSYGCNVDVCEPHVNKSELFGCRNIRLGKGFKGYDFLIKAVAHDCFKELTCDYEVMKHNGTTAEQRSGIATA